MMIKTKFNGFSPDGIRTYPKGGGGGGAPYYENQDKLFGAQADIALGVYNNIFAPYAPKAVGDLNDMREEAASGVLTRRARESAGADAGSALGSSIDATNRNLARYGLDPHKFAADSNMTALGGAAMKVDAMTKANQWGEGQKWGRSYDFYNALSGVPSQTTQALGQAGQGYGRMGSEMMANDRANAAGYGQFGGALASRAMGLKDGGPVERRLAAGGPAAGGMPRINWRSISTSGSRMPEATSPMEAIISGAAPVVAGKAVEAGGKTALHGLMNSPMMTQAAAPVSTAVPVAVANPGVATAAEQGALMNGLGDTAVAEGVAGTGTAVAEGAAGAAAAEGAAATAAAEGVAGAAAANAWNPVGWVLGAGALLGASGAFDDMFADGGQVKKGGLRGKRKDMRKGGKVAGPGTETSDSIPARLSDGEYVLNAEAVKLIGKDKLEAINNAGLMRRYGEQKLAEGGWVSSLKRALGGESEAERTARVRRENEDRLRRYDSRESGGSTTPVSRQPSADPSIGGAVDAIRKRKEMLDSYAKGGLVKRKGR